MAKMNISIGKGEGNINITTAKANIRDRVNECSADCEITACYSAPVYVKLEPRLYELFHCYVEGKRNPDNTYLLTAYGLKSDETAIKKIMKFSPEFKFFL